ncbi:MAG TPA: hypothetical protein VKZ68_00945 [Ohtaekwangia sp.]|nr:hypothetical protein [Ohtaekwangia sp.]
MLTRLFTIFCCMSCTLVTAQVNDPFLVDKTGLPAQARPSPSIRYQNTRPQQMPRIKPGTTPFPVTRDSNLNPRGNEDAVSPLRYNSSENIEQSWIDTVRIFHFDANGNRYRDPSQVYRDLNPRPTQPQTNESQNDTYRRADDVDSNIAPWERSDDSDSSED